tara:strand:- start:2906 stop:3409 length:504 start_codon:yes stop_codon:yes gene_type:complete
VRRYVCRLIVYTGAQLAVWVPVIIRHIISKAPDTVVFRNLFICLTMIGLLVGGLIPAGYMPSLSADGQVLEMVICSVDGPKTVYMQIDADDTDTSDDTSDDKGGHKVCAYAGVVLASVDAPDFVELKSLPVASDIWFAGHQTLSARLEAVPPPSRGPPSERIANPIT